MNKRLVQRSQGRRGEAEGTGVNQALKSDRTELESEFLLSQLLNHVEPPFSPATWR